MFMGRAVELKKLDALYNSGKFECVVVHGRWRAGKTALLREFIKDRKAIYFAAQETGNNENLEYFKQNILAVCKGPDKSSLEIKDYNDAFESVCELARSERIILVMDDFQFLVSSCKTISELICAQIEQRLSESLLMLVICGSSPMVMETETLGYNSVFHGKRTAQLKLRPFTFFETKRHFDRFTPFDIAVIYGITSGVPKYLKMMDPEVPLRENIQRAFFDNDSFILEEPANILRREVRDPVHYNAVLRAIASGCSKNSEISAAVRLETGACTAYLKNLIAMGLVGKYTPLTEKAGKKTIYEIKDSMFRFWYRFVPDSMSLIKSGAADRAWRGVAQGIPSFMSKVFEEICREWLTQQNQAGRLPVNCIEVGRWWGFDPVWKNDTQIPIVAYTDDDNAVFCDCVWSDEPAGSDKIISLMERSRLFRCSERYLYLFSRSGFSDDCVEAAGRIGANLVSFE